jgi:hypothetical protein
MTTLPLSPAHIPPGATDTNSRSQPSCLTHFYSFHPYKQHTEGDQGKYKVTSDELVKIGALLGHDAPAGFPGR